MLLFKNNSNSRDQQIAENTKDIAMLKEIVGQVYMTPLSSGIPDGTIADPDLWTIGLADTDLPSDIELGTSQGYLLTSGDSKLFKLVNVRADAGTGDIVVDLMYLCDIQGKDGEKGADGQDGQNATSIELGTVTEGDEASATLTPVGDGVYVLDLVLPRGEQGERGATGEAGADGQNAVISGVTATIDSGVGTPDIDVEMSGTPQNRTFNFDFHNLKGDKGDDATSLSIGTVSTLQPNQQATASLTSDGDGNYELDLGIPKGANGTNGVDGKGFEYVRKFVPATDWEVNTGTNPTTPTYYPYRAFIPIDPDLNGQSPVILNFTANAIESFNFAPYCTFATINDVGGVYIFSNDNTVTADVRILYYIAEEI